jgi:hypothetical protein
MRRRAVTLAELVVATGLVALLAAPLIVLLTTSDHEAMTSEDYMAAEALALRHLDETCATPWRDLLPRLPLTRTAKELGKFDVSLRAELIQDGLIAVEVELAWAVKPGAPGTRRYGLVRLRARPDHAIRVPYPFGDGAVR